MKRLIFDELVNVNGGDYIIKEEEDGKICYVTINNKLEPLPFPLTYGLLTGNIDVEFCKNGISDEEANFWYNISSAKKLKKLILAFEA